MDMELSKTIPLKLKNTENLYIIDPPPPTSTRCECSDGTSVSSNSRGWALQMSEPLLVSSTFGQSKQPFNVKK